MEFFFIIFSPLILHFILIIRLFYNNHMVQVVCNLMETQVDLHNFRRARNNLIFTNTLHYANQQDYLNRIFNLYNYFRLLAHFPMLVTVFYFQLSMGDKNESELKKSLSQHKFVTLLFFSQPKGF